jgi:hypothetical protein
MMLFFFLLIDDMNYQGSPPLEKQNLLEIHYVEKIEIPFFPLPEQEKIAEILSTVDERLQLLKEKKEGLKKVKEGIDE